MKNGDAVAIVLAGGSGSRMNLDKTKQRIILGGESILHRTVRIFDETADIASIIAVVRGDEYDFAENELKDIKKLSKIVIGGSTRAESASNGFSYVGEDFEYVVIHDAARCFVTPEIISAVLADAKKYGAATASCRIVDTVKAVDAFSSVVSTVDRNTLVLVQTPQIFKREMYGMALANADLSDPSVTDDNFLLERMGVKIHCTDTGAGNIKITHREDLRYANFLLSLTKYGTENI